MAAAGSEPLVLFLTYAKSQFREGNGEGDLEIEGVSGKYVVANKFSKIETVQLPNFIKIIKLIKKKTFEIEINRFGNARLQSFMTLT